LLVPDNVTVQGDAEAYGFNGLGMAPVGTILMWTGDRPPSGWVLCDGATVAGVRTPDLRGRFVVAPATTNSLWRAAGSETYSHRLSELPAHRHWAQLRGESSRNADQSHEYRVALGGGDITVTPGLGPVNSEFGTVTTEAGGEHTHSLTLPSFNSEVAGAGAPRSVMPPFYVLAFIMRVQ
jgi:microcystin-dependent protein